MLLAIQLAAVAATAALAVRPLAAWLAALAATAAAPSLAVRLLVRVRP